jgi:hypothetical protein
MSLTTGRRRSRNRWTVLPMPQQDVINRIIKLGQQQQMTEGIEFYDRDQQDIGDQEDDTSKGDTAEELNDDGHTIIEIADEDEDYNNYDYNHNNGFEYVFGRPEVGSNIPNSKATYTSTVRPGSRGFIKELY